MHAMPMPALRPRPSGLRDWLTTVDHKKIGLMYFWFCLVMGMVGGYLSGLIRVHLAMPGATLEALHQARLTGEALPANLFSEDGHLYNQVLTMHATVMIFLVIIPAWGAFANYLVPLMIGARDMAFPKLNALAFWLLIPSALLLLASFLVVGGAAAAGWTAYPPLSVQYSPGPGQDLWALGLHLAGLSSILGAINLIVTIANLRCPGMGWRQLPLFCWGVLVTALIQVTATPIVAAAVTMVLLDRNVGTTLLDAGRGGDPLLYQHIFWFYSHPAVYIMILPGLGAASHIFAAFARKPVFGYLGMVLALIGIAVLGNAVWAHHMFSVGMPTALQAYFMYASYAIAVPTGIKIFSWLATMWGGQLVFTTAMKFACGMIALFTLGGIGGLVLATVPIDYSLHDTYFVVGHFHFTLVGGSLMLIFAMTYYWWPKMTGRILDERIGTVVFWLMFIGVLLAFATMHVTGMAGMARRVAVYHQDFAIHNHLTTIGYLLAFIGSLIFSAQVLLTWLRPANAGDDPWLVNDVQRSFEWATSSPPPPWNFARIPPIPMADFMPSARRPADDRA